MTDTNGATRASDDEVRAVAARVVENWGTLRQRDPRRIPAMLAELERVWTENPDLRLGQLVTVAHRRGERAFERTTDLFNLEDDALLEKLRRWQDE